MTVKDFFSTNSRTTQEIVLRDWKTGVREEFASHTEMTAEWQNAEIQAWMVISCGGDSTFIMTVEK